MGVTKLDLIRQRDKILAEIFRLGLEDEEISAIVRIIEERFELLLEMC